MKLLHSADLHLDRSFEGLKAFPEQVGQKLQDVNKRVLHNLIDTALKNQVDAVIFAGDTFHQSQTSIQTQAYFFEGLERLIKEDIHVMISFGNHDYYSAERYWFDFPKQVFLFEQEDVETHYFVTRNNERVAVSGFSYLHPWIEENKLSEFPLRASEADIHIGIYHGELSTNRDSRYAPFALSEMKALGYDYWALGHIHKPEVLSADPLIVYPGTPQGHTKKEIGVQGVGVVNLGNGPATIRFEETAEVYWEKTRYSLKEYCTKKEALTFLEKGLFDEATHRQTFLLKEIVLTDIEQLGEAFQIACTNGEILSYLQKKTAETGRLFVFQLSTKGESSFQKIPIRASAQLLEQLEKNYLQPEIFAEAAKELLQQPQFSKMQPIDALWREKCIERADQHIKEYFMIKEDQ